MGFGDGRLRPVNESDLRYAKFSKTLAAVQGATGLTESAAFLLWFLENIYRLEETEARDAICDHSSDKGIDGIYVDHNEQEIHFLQSKIRQKDKGTIGDVGPKNLVASVAQFDSKEKVEAILSGNADKELKQLLVRARIGDFVEAGYELVSVYVSNESHDADSRGYEKLGNNIRIYDRKEIADRVIEVDPPAGKPEFTFDVSYVEPMSMASGATPDKPTMFVFPAKALQLVHMDGISDGSLFRENVRYTLGNTSVNKSIRRSIADKKTHPHFVLFHNGITILCTDVDVSVEGALTVKHYSVVNGAQSLTSFFNEKSRLTDDLRVLVKIVALRDDSLARTITENSNNQNAIKPRDLRSNHKIMVRLQREMNTESSTYFFEIKRGEQTPAGRVVISNDEAGRALLAFDVQEPWSAHQIYKVFDEKYSDIFGRPEVTANRIIFIKELLSAVDASMTKVKNRPMATYTLTRYFVLYVLARILRSDATAAPFVADPSILNDTGRAAFVAKCGELLKTVVVDLNYESGSVDFDYKSVLKSPKQCSDLANQIIASYEKDVARDKAESFDGWMPAS
jgi:hypothetical protein